MQLVFLHSSDTHGFLLPTDYQQNGQYEAPFGLARLSQAVKYEKAKYGADHLVVTDAGDCLQGSPLASYAHSLPIAEGLAPFTAAYNAVGYDARCLGNHDFNFGLDYLSWYVTHNRAPIINDNVLDANTETPRFGQTYQIIEKAGIKIGLLGVVTPYIPHWEQADHIAGLKFVSAAKQVRHYAKILKPQVDILAVMYHGGFENDPVTGEATEPDRGENEGYRILTEIPGVDVFLTGHQHRRMNLVAHQTAMVQPGYRGEALAEVLVEFDPQTKKITQLKTQLVDTATFAPDPAVVAPLKKLNAGTQAWLDQTVATLSAPASIEHPLTDRITGAPFINLLQQMQLWFTKADISATAIMSETAKGFGKTVTMRDIILNYPYANQLVRVRLTGKQIRHIMEFSAGFLEKDANGQIKFLDRYLLPKPQLYHFDVFYPVHYEVDLSRPVGHRICQLSLHGQSLDDQQVYHLAVNNYRANGGGFYPEYRPDEIELVLDKDYVQMFAEYLTQGNEAVDVKPNYRFF